MNIFKTYNIWDYCLHTNDTYILFNQSKYEKYNNVLKYGKLYFNPRITVYDNNILEFNATERNFIFINKPTKLDKIDIEQLYKLDKNEIINNKSSRFVIKSVKKWTSWHEVELKYMYKYLFKSYNPKSKYIIPKIQTVVFYINNGIKVKWSDNNWCRVIIDDK